MSKYFNKKVMLAGGVSLAMALSMGMGVMAEEAAEEAAGATYSTVVEVEDWGATITKVIVDMGQEVSGEVGTDAFEVMVTRTDERGEEPLSETGKRRVTSAYVSDAEGNGADSGNYVTLELAYGPAVSLGSALNYAEGRNIWIDCDYTITQQEAIGDVSGVVADECSGTRRLEIEDFNISSGTYDGIEFSIADYKPEDNGEARPLIIWLHGGGEGGTDATIPLAANRAVSLAGEEIQSYFGGAYVLVPQSPTYWMEGEGSDRDGTSIYEAGLMELIQDYVANNNIDTNRIYVGGCSNGGYMTMLLIRDYPDYFAAAYPVCEGLADTLVSDEDIATYMNQNIWFVLAATDTTLDPVIYSVPTYVRLKEAGAENVHMTFFENVSDTSGLYRQENDLPHEYDGHWSWTYVYNNQVSANIGGEEVNLFDWMAAQTLAQ